MNSYTKGPIGKTMLLTACSMLSGTIALSGYNIADTYFVSGLGTLSLAAMGYTFPVIMLLSCIYRGLGVGVMTTVAQFLGGEKRTRASKFLTFGLCFVAVSAVVLGIAGYLSIEPTFALLGASDEVMNLIRQYMAIWYLGSITIAAGSTKTVSIIMFSGMLLNVGLDPLFIFGGFFVPPMGIQGAAIATVLSQGLSAVAVITLLRNKHRLLKFVQLSYREIKMICSTIIKYAIPSTIGMLLMPIGNAIVTKLIASFGDDAVAACAAAGRLEIIAFIFPMSLGIALMPMVAQNYGAKLYSRINQCRRFSMRFAFYFELGMAVVYFVSAPYLVGFFSDDENVKIIMTAYLRIIPFGFGLMEIHRFGGFFYTGCGRPAIAAGLNTLRIVVLMIPLSLLAAYLNSLLGIFFARLASDVLSGLFAWWAARRLTLHLPADGVTDLNIQNTQTSQERKIATLDEICSDSEL